MNCPECGAGTKVLTSKDNGASIRRRRQCLSDSSHRFTTEELMISRDARFTVKFRTTDDNGLATWLSPLNPVTKEIEA